MPKLSQLYPSKYLTKDDIGAGAKFTIQSVTVENVGKEDDPESKPVLHFLETPKPFVLNRTNAEIIGGVYTDDTDLWNGKEIVVYFDPNVSFAGKRTGGLRVRPPKSVVEKDPLPF